jgi:hypothetical protein
MPRACPHCGAPYFTYSQVFANSILLSGSRRPLECFRCNSLSYVPLVGRNTRWGLAILGLGFVSSYPSAASSQILASLPKFIVAAIRLEIWAIAIIAASCVYAFANPLEKLEARVSQRWNLWIFPLRTLFLLALLLYGYFLFRQLPHGP